MSKHPIGGVDAATELSETLSLQEKRERAEALVKELRNLLEESFDLIIPGIPNPNHTTALLCYEYVDWATVEERVADSAISQLSTAVEFHKQWPTMDVGKKLAALYDSRELTCKNLFGEAFQDSLNYSTLREIMMLVEGWVATRARSVLSNRKVDASDLAPSLPLHQIDQLLALPEPILRAFLLNMGDLAKIMTEQEVRDGLNKAVLLSGTEIQAIMSHLS